MQFLKIGADMLHIHILMRCRLTASKTLSAVSTSDLVSDKSGIFELQDKFAKQGLIYYNNRYFIWNLGCYFLFKYWFSRKTVAIPSLWCLLCTKICLVFISNPYQAEFCQSLELQVSRYVDLIKSFSHILQYLHYCYHPYFALGITGSGRSTDSWDRRWDRGWMQQVARPTCHLAHLTSWNSSVHTLWITCHIFVVPFIFQIATIFINNYSSAVKVFDGSGRVFGT